MEVEEAKILLGFSPSSRPDPSQVKAAYRKKVWESHPDLFPDDQKLRAESKFKSISEAYSCLESGSVRVGEMKFPDENDYRRFESSWSYCCWKDEFKETMTYYFVIAITVLSSFGFYKFADQDTLTLLYCDGKGQRYSRPGSYSRVVRTGVPRTYASAKRGNPWLIGAPFLFIVFGTIGLGGLKANRAYNLQKQTFPSHNPFLP